MTVTDVEEIIRAEIAELMIYAAILGPQSKAAGEVAGLRKALNLLERVEEAS